MLEKQHYFTADRYVLIPYEELAADPKAAIEKIYNHFGLVMSEEIKARLQSVTRRSRNYKSKHTYSLEEYGLSKEWIQKELAGVIEAYGFQS